MTTERDEDDTTFRVDTSASAPRGYRFVVVTSAGTVEHQVGAIGTVTLGRGRENRVRVDDPSVSRAHAEVVLGPTLLVRDLRSANGVFVGGKRIASGALVALGAGEMLQIGNVSVAITPVASNPPTDADRPAQRARTATPVAGTRAADDPTPSDALASDSPKLRDELVSIERRRMLAALERFAGNQTRAAESLGMPRRTFVKRLGEYGIARPRK